MMNLPQAMRAADGPRSDPLEERLLVIQTASGGFRDARVSDLATHLSPGDLLIVNDAATLPASLALETRAIEVRLLAQGASERHWKALLFGAGDYRTPTELRPLPEPVRVGEQLAFSPALTARVTEVDAEQPRWIEIEFETDGAELWQALYRHGKPIQYAHVTRPLELWHTQTRFAARPWAVELPSAGRPLTFQLLSRLREHGVRTSFVTHAAGLSSTGSQALDRRLPVPELYEIPAAAARAIAETRRAGGRVVAVGTTVVRALEASALANQGDVRAERARAQLVIGPGFRPQIVSAILTGMHEPGTSHFALLSAFANAELLGRALRHAGDVGYLAHEFGDFCLIL